MSDPENIHDVIEILRTADIATMWTYSQHMAGVLKEVEHDLHTLSSLIFFTEQINLTNIGDSLTKAEIVSVMPENVVRDLLGVLARDYCP